MDIFNPLFEILLRSTLVLLPLTVVWLAFRRLALSKSGNAWVYAATCLLAAITTAGTLPWAMGLTEVNWIFLALALFCPPLWFGVALLCDALRRSDYVPDPVINAALSLLPRRLLGKWLPTEAEQTSNLPVPVFRHSRAGAPRMDEAEDCLRDAAPGARSLMSIAREIRSNRNSDRRRPKLLPAPDDRDLPFVRGASQG